MPNYLKHEVPRRLPNGSTAVYCRKCGREIAASTWFKIRSIGECAVCKLVGEGVVDPEKYVIPQYIMTDPTKPPVPMEAELGEDAAFLLFPEDKPVGNAPPIGGIAGTLKAIYRAIGFGKQASSEEIPESKRVVLKRRGGGLRS